MIPTDENQPSEDELVPDCAQIAPDWLHMPSPCCPRCGGFIGKHHRFCQLPISGRFVKMAQLVEAGESRLMVGRSDYDAWPWHIREGPKVLALFADNQMLECFAGFLEQLPALLNLILELRSLPNADTVFDRERPGEVPPSLP